MRPLAHAHDERGHEAEDSLGVGPRTRGGRLISPSFDRSTGEDASVEVLFLPARLRSLLDHHAVISDLLDPAHIRDGYHHVPQDRLLLLAAMFQTRNAFLREHEDVRG